MVHFHIFTINVLQNVVNDDLFKSSPYVLLDKEYVNSNLFHTSTQMTANLIAFAGVTR